MKNTGTALTVLSAAGMAWPGQLTAAAGYLRDFQPVPDLDEVRGRILYYASLAPSGHNTQPWAVKITPEGFTVGQDPARRLPAVDPANRELLLSLGAFIENLCLAAAVYGFRGDCEATAPNALAEDIAKIKLTKDKPAAYPLRRLELRRTIRKGQLNREMKPADVAALLAPVQDRAVFFPAASGEAGLIRQYAAASFAAQAHRAAAQEELSRWIRFSNAEAEKHRDGLTTAGMEITGIAGLAVRLFMTGADVTKPTFIRQGIDLTNQLVGEGGGWVIITGAGATVAELVETGRKFERMALLARELGIGIHPMTQQLEEEAWQPQVRDLLKGPTPQFVLRVGYVDAYPDPVSPRRPVAWFVRN